MTSIKELSSIQLLTSENYLSWSRRLSAYFRVLGAYKLVIGTETRPDDAKPTEQANWDERALKAAGAIGMVLDEANATHIIGLEDDPVAMWTKLDQVHNSRTPGTRFNAMDALFNIKKEPEEDLASLITRSEAALQRVRALRPATDYAAPSINLTSTSNQTTTIVYTLQTLDEELVIMTLLRALPETYQHVRSSLLIQPSLTLDMVRQAFYAEDEHRKHRGASQVAASALRAFTPRNQSTGRNPISNHHQSQSSHQSLCPVSSSPNHVSNHQRGPCYFCAGENHIERDCRKKKRASEQARASTTANVANASSDNTQASEPAEAFAANASTPIPPLEARSNLNADTGATRIMMGDEKLFASL